MKAFNAERVLNSQLKYIFGLFCFVAIIFLIRSSNPSTVINLHPWLAGIISTTLELDFACIVAIRLLFIIGSTVLLWLISVKKLDMPGKNYFLFLTHLLVHFSIIDWSFGLVVSIYWTVFLFILFQLMPTESSTHILRKTFTAAILSGIIMLNGAFAVLFFFVGIIAMIVSHEISFRRVVVWTTGFLLPFLYLLFWYFMTDKLNIIFVNLDALVLEEEMFKFSFPLNFTVSLAILFLLALIAHSRMSESKISIRRNYTIILFSLITLAPAIITSVFNIYILFSLYGLATILYWLRLIYNTRKRFYFFILLLMPLVIPVLFNFLINYQIN
jgi:hypothetical protein